VELALSIIFALIIGAFICEFIDSSLGMMYGTILNPVLIISGFDPLIVVPSILLSQAMGGIIAAVFHHRFENVIFHLTSEDSRTVYVITILGVIATIISVFVAVNIPKWALKTYIGVLVLCMGIVLLFKAKFDFSWRRIFIIGLISAFNKGISGGDLALWLPVVRLSQVEVAKDL